MEDIPFIDLAADHRALRADLLAAIGRVLDHGQFILGPEVDEFERQIAAFIDVRHAIGVNSGTDALFLALRALDIGPGDEVITVPNSFIATTSAIVAVGARPVFVDVGPDLNMDPDAIAPRVTPRTKAILVVHLAGRPARMEPILAAARSRGLSVIEDAAQAIGTMYHGRKVGALGDIGCFSLHPLKTLSACGDAGFLTTSNDAIARRLRVLRNIGLASRDRAEVWGPNARLDTIQAAILLTKLPRLDAWIAVRRAHAAAYSAELRDVVEVPDEEPGTMHTYHTFVIQTDRRDALQAFLAAEGIGTKIHYPIPIHLQDAARLLGYTRGDFPVCERQATRILSLPISHTFSPDARARVIAAIRRFCITDAVVATSFAGAVSR